jgi:hypothetical protein
MALALDDPLLWGVVFVLVFLIEVAIILNLRAHRTVHTYESASDEPVLGEGEDLTDILSRFVEDESGKKIGETVGMDGALVIVKSREAPHYRAIPRDRLSAQGEGFRVAQGVDWAEAARRGEAWRERQHRLVTYSEDELPEDERSARVG